MRTSKKGVFGLLESRNRLLTTHRRKILEKLAKGLTGFEIVEQGLKRHSRSDEHERSTHNLWMTVNDRTCNLSHSCCTVTNGTCKLKTTWHTIDPFHVFVVGSC